MRKILFISYYYPPCNLTASNRVFSWAKFLAKNNFEITVLTRHWPAKIESFNDIYQHEKLGELHTINEGIKVIRVDEYNSIFKKI
ncbi:MAG TPA: hypothetical protein DEF82_08575, partial [Crocinitomicaceae bacterium]|nr:hypothetical protein [Crocinitomicaceae bacterium]